MNSVINTKPCHFTSSVSAAPVPTAQRAVLIMDACPVTALGMQRALTDTCGITAPVRYVQCLADIPATLGATPPALLIMDVCGEKESVLDGLRLLTQLRSSHPAMRIVICTDFSDYRILELLASSEANGILLKNEPVLALVQCVTHVMAEHSQWLSPKAKLLLSKMNPKNTALTARELDVLAYLFSGLSVSRVAMTLHRDIRTVSTHKRNAMAKLGFQNDSELFAQGTWMAKIGPCAGL